MTALVIHRLRAVVEADPAAIAIACAGEPVLTYAALWQRARAIAATLVEAGVGEGDVVALHVEKSPDFVVGMIATWLAGAAWVPVLPELPEARRKLIVDETRARIALIASDRVPPWLAQQCRVVDLRGSQADRDPRSTQTSGDRAYVIYTSGSTGQPKGVVVSHRGLVPMLDAQIAAFDLRAGDRCLWLLSPGFDASVSDVGTALLAGATLHIEHPARLRSASGLLEVLRQRAITHVDLPPSLLPLLPSDQTPPVLRTIIVGGEVCAPAAIRAWASRVRVVNVYGPTEATVCTSLVVCDASWDRPLLGVPLPHVEYAIVDDELWITGPGVADGYLDRPALEAAKFVWRDGNRWFRTGDRVRGRDSELEFVGRIDRQLKIAGVLVAPEEIEAHLRDHPEILDVAVSAEPLGERDGLVAHYVATRDLAPELRDLLALHLDARLIPRRFLRVASLPRTPSGKLATRGHAPGSQPRDLIRGLDGNVQTADLTATERTLVAIWSRLLGIRATRDDDFFTLGGDSLAVMEHVGLAELAGLAMTAEHLYAQPTLSSLAATIDRGPSNISTSSASVIELIDDLTFVRFSPDPDCSRAVETPERDPGEIVLTGATGFLGARVLSELVARSDAAVTCVVREPTQLIPVLREIGAAHVIGAMSSRVRVIAGDLTVPRMGLPAASWEVLAATADAIVHCAADVSIAKPYRALRGANVEGTARVLELAASGRAKRVHHASTLSVFVGSDRTPGTLCESDLLESAQRLHGGYAQSKWAAEYLAREAGATIYRFGLLTGDTRTGRAPARDWLTWFVRGLARVGAVPRLAADLRVDITPIDHAARALATLVLEHASGTFHVANPQSATLGDLVAALHRAGVRLDEVEPDRWPATVAAAELDALPEVAAAVLGLCRGGESFARVRTCDVFQATGCTFDTTRTSALVGPCPAPTAALLDLYVERALEER